MVSLRANAYRIAPVLFDLVRVLEVLLPPFPGKTERGVANSH